VGLEEVDRVSAYHGEVRFGFRFVIEGDRGLLPHGPSRSEDVFEGVGRQSDGGEVIAFLGLARHQLAPEQLDRVQVVEGARGDEATVVGSSPGSRASKGIGHHRVLPV
jgi:hypothetical protein